MLSSMILRIFTLSFALLTASCANGPPDGSPTEPSQADSPDFHGIGQEPGWLLDIHHGGPLVFEYAYGQKQLVVPAPEPQKVQPSGNILYRANAGEQDLQVTIMPSHCTDAMSGRPFDYTVTVTLDGKSFHGCGTRNPDQDWQPGNAATDPP